MAISPVHVLVAGKVSRNTSLQVVEGKRLRGRPRASDDEFRCESVWGLMHLDCFLRAIEAPDQVLGLGG